MFNLSYRTGIVITELGITALLLYKKNRRWQLQHYWQTLLKLNPCHPIPTEVLMEPLMQLGSLLSQYRHSVGLMVTQLPIFTLEIPLLNSFITPYRLSNIALQAALQHSGISKDQITIDYRVTQHMTQLSIVGCQSDLINQWRTLLAQATMPITIFESEQTLQEQCRQRYPIIATEHKVSLTWLDFKISAAQNQAQLDENTILAIGLATRPRDKLCC